MDFFTVDTVLLQQIYWATVMIMTKRLAHQQGHTSVVQQRLGPATPRPAGHLITFMNRL